jgi:Fur family ferric uptake transcriptional regulator
MQTEDQLAAALRDSGRRLTRQRQLVLDVLTESEQHLDAEGVHDQAKARDPNISLATVYRTLSLLKEVGLVEEHRLGEDHAHFEAVPEEPHYHFTCALCGRVIEFDAPQVTQVVRRLSEQEGLQINQVHLLLRGTCDRCQSEGVANSYGN